MTKEGGWEKAPVNVPFLFLDTQTAWGLPIWGSDI